MFGFPPQMNSSKALFETQERSWNSAWNNLVVTCRLEMGARRLSRCLICIQIFVASDPFFVDPCTNNVWASDPIFDVCTQTCRLQSLFLILAHKKTSTKPDNVNNTNTMTKNLCRMILWGSMLFDCVRELVCSLLALSIAHVKKHTLKKSSGHAGNQKHTWVGYPSVSSFGQAYGTSFCQVDMDSRSRPRRAGTPKPLANVLCRLAKKFGKSARHT